MLSGFAGTFTGLTVPKGSASAIERFYQKVNFAGPLPTARSELGNCYVWTGHLNAGGYGKFHLSKDSPERLAHRIVFILHGEPLQETGDHLCRTRSCVRRSHIEDVSLAINGSRVPSVNGAKTHCGTCGNPFDVTNTYRYPDGRRDCRICRRRWTQEYKERQAV